MTELEEELIFKQAIVSIRAIIKTYKIVPTAEMRSALIEAYVQGATNMTSIAMDVMGINKNERREDAKKTRTSKS